MTNFLVGWAVGMFSSFIGYAVGRASLTPRVPDEEV